ncbi:hypothetical protein [Kordiimonas sp.]|uniref:DUF3108 domain-containing protein n=1 Tax=Kordiimonas sp. TaxID=1970157 RepID=UPI003A8D0C9B
MNKRFKALALIALMLKAAPAAVADWRSGLNLEDADLKLFRMVMISEGVEAGAMEYGWTRIGDRYLVEDRTHMVPDTLESASALIDAQTLLPYNVMIKFSMTRSMMNVDLRWADGHRRGQMITRGTDKSETVRDIDLVEDKHAPLRMAAIGFIAAMPLDEGYRTSFDWFNTMANRVEKVRVAVASRTRVSSPAGTFVSHKVELRGVAPGNNLYITAAKPRRIVRIDVVGQDMYFLRAPD